MSDTKKRFRLVTRSDFDGLACAVLLKELDLIDDILFVHPKDMQDGRIEITNNDITTNVPYVAECHLAFDHHYSETIRGAGRVADNHVIDPEAPSAARVVYRYYGAKSFPNLSPAMLEAVDKADSADFTVEDIIDPSGWVLLSFLMDARTGLGRFRDFRISNYELMMALIDYCHEHTIEEILELPDVKERVELYFSQVALAREQIMRCATVHDTLVVMDLRNEETIYAGNRFLVYVIFADCNMSMHVMWGKQKQNTVFAMGNSIVNRTSHINIGEVALQYGGGGHANAGTCQVPNDRSDELLGELIEKITAEVPMAVVTPSLPS